MTIKDLISESTKLLANVGIASARLDSELLITHALEKDRAWLLAHDNQALTNVELRQCRDLIKKRVKRLPLSYVLNHKEFYGLDFYVDKRVLTPRDETELIADEVIKNAPRKSSLIDVGTGSGALAIAIKKHRPDLKVHASELSQSALEVAIINTEKILGDNYGIKFIASDLFKNITGKFDTITANLPYVSTDYRPRMMAEVKHEPDVALFGGPGDGLDLYRQFFTQAPDFLRSKGRIYLESDPWQQDELVDIARTNGLKLVFQNYLILGFSR